MASSMGSRSSSSMALALLPLLLALAAASMPSLASASAPLDNGEELLMLGRFHGWMAAHGRSYATEEEKLHRFQIYRSNMEFIAAANRDPRMRYQLGETPFTDLTHDEFMAMNSGGGDLPPLPEEEEEQAAVIITTRAGPVHEGAAHGGGRDDLRIPLAAVEEPPHRISSVTAAAPPPPPPPASIDWRTKGVVTPAKYQGANCNSCWAFSSVATMESAQAIAKGGSPPLLSEQQLVDCDRYDYGCGGGWMDRAFNWVVQNGGITSSAAYPYTEHVGACQTGKPAVVRLSGYKMLPRGNETALLAAVAQQPVAVAFDYSDPCFQHYIGGVYDAGCSKNGVYTGNACRTAQNHALAIVGYGTKADGTKYWIGKNSWSANWGDNGFVYMLRDSPPLGVCGLAQRPSYPIIDV